MRIGQLAEVNLLSLGIATVGLGGLIADLLSTFILTDDSFAAPNYDRKKAQKDPPVHVQM